METRGYDLFLQSFFMICQTYNQPFFIIYHEQTLSLS